MATAQYVQISRAGIGRCAELLTTATQAQRADGAAVHAANLYLSSWSKLQIWNLQKIDGGWGPFDTAGRPELMHKAPDIARVSEAMHRQRLALNEAGIDPTPELIELEQFFGLLTRQVAEQARAARHHCDRSGSSAAGNPLPAGRTTPI